MAAKRTWGRCVTPFNCISGDFGELGCSVGFVSVVPVVSVVVAVVWFRRSRFGVSGCSTCGIFNAHISVILSPDF